MRCSSPFVLGSCLAAAAVVAGKTVFTGDTLHGVPIISSLDVTDGPANTISRYWISPSTAQGGLQFFLPVFVARGTQDSIGTGPKLSLSASIHGDELNPVAVVQKVFGRLNETVGRGGLRGTIIGLPTQNPSGNFLNQRNFFISSSNGFFSDLNRVFPGRRIEDGGSLPSSYAAAIWNDVWGNTSNVDVAVDFHTLSTGSKGPLWAYADYALEGVRQLAELAEPDMIKIDPGQPGSIETSFVSRGTPAITLEIGPANAWSQDLIQRSVDYAFRLMDHFDMTRGGLQTPDLSKTYIANNFSDVSTLYSGWAEVDVEPLQDVQAGEIVGRIYNSWGDLLQNLTSEVSGRVLTVLVDPAVEAGAGIVSIGYNATERT